MPASILVGVHVRLCAGNALGILDEVVNRWNGFLIRAADFIAARFIIFVAEFVNRVFERCPLQPRHVLNCAGRGHAEAAARCQIADIAGRRCQSPYVVYDRLRDHH
jgi:hypothetical protein